MSREMPSLAALLGLLAVAGYQNRDKIAEMLGGPNPGASVGPPGQSNQQGGGVGSVLSGGLRDLVERFRQSGQGKAADSWVSTGPNHPIGPDQLEQAVGADVLNTLAERTGLTREQLRSRLTREIPSAVDKFTPDGRLPTEDEAARLI